MCYDPENVKKNDENQPSIYKKLNLDNSVERTKIKKSF